MGTKDDWTSKEAGARRLNVSELLLWVLISWDSPTVIWSRCGGRTSDSGRLTLRSIPSLNSTVCYNSKYFT